MRDTATGETPPHARVILPDLGRQIALSTTQAEAMRYATQQQDSRDLKEPFSNVQGGLGVFSAFASDTTRVVVAKP